ncbi:MAG: hypothetical protein WDO69_08560 [Pseudomonadota bacterium]
MKAHSKDDLAELTDIFRANEISAAAPPPELVTVFRAATGRELSQEAALAMAQWELS